VKHLVLVYGTLRAHQPNHGLLRGAPCLGRASLKDAVLVDLGPFPGAVRGRGVVTCELYEVNDRVLADLDLLEGTPKHYRRVATRGPNGKRAWVYIYNCPIPIERQNILGGDWVAWLRGGDL
jgi:gamma-glutamylcyclotransferase (GGCT)/AIG2-like uncharacterized protein YtfP